MRKLITILQNLRRNVADLNHGVRLATAIQAARQLLRWAPKKDGRVFCLGNCGERLTLLNPPEDLVRGKKVTLIFSCSYPSGPACLALLGPLFGNVRYEQAEDIYLFFAETVIKTDGELNLINPAQISEAQ